jgi:hypothetical protein
MTNQRFLSWLKKSKLKIPQFLLYLVIFGFASYKIVEYYSDKAIVKNNYKLTIGKIVEYDEIGIEPKSFLTYSYTANGKLYKREICCPNKVYDGCAENIALCDKKRFVVLYSKSHPEKSLIDLTLEIQEVKNPKFPNSLSKFQ